MMILEVLTQIEIGVIQQIMNVYSSGQKPSFKKAPQISAGKNGVCLRNRKQQFF